MYVDFPKPNGVLDTYYIQIKQTPAGLILLIF